MYNIIQMKQDVRRNVRGVAVGWLAALSVLITGPAQAADDRVVVMTSYPEEVSTRYQTAFEQAYPGKRVEILWRQSADALTYLSGGGAKDVDVYWTPSPGNFIALRDQGLLAQPVLNEDNSRLPKKIGGTFISDPDGYFYAFELAGYGIAYHPGAVAALGVTPPTDWRDLADPAYAGKVIMPVPAQVGFAPQLMESILQTYGWDKGWALLAEIAGNAVLDVRPANFSQEPVAAGQMATRMTMDFFMSFAAPTEEDKPLAFVYAKQSVFNPAQIALFAHAQHPQTANAFINFVLSRDGQALLVHPDIHRLPARPDLYTGKGKVNPFAAGHSGYDACLARQRDGLMSAVFDVELVARHDELTALWQALHQAEKADGKAGPQIAEARMLLSTVTVNDTVQKDDRLRALFARQGQPHGKQETDSADARERAAVRAQWAEARDERINKVRILLGVEQENMP